LRNIIGTEVKKSLSVIAGMAALAGLLAFSACKPPEYIRYNSDFGDFTVEVPWGWNVYLDGTGTADFYNYTFVGPFEPDFLHGVPSLSIRWYGNNEFHRLPDGRLERYASADDFIVQTLRDVYGPEHVLVTPTKDDPKEIQRISVSGWEGKHFIVVAPGDIPADNKFGTRVEKDGARTAVLRQHDYVILPMDTGFYVLVYPATKEGYDRYLKRFGRMVKTFKALKDGPVGPKL